MRDIQLKDAKATLSAVIDAILRGETFAITRHGKREAVVLSWEHWEKLSNVPRFGELLTRAPEAMTELAPRDESPPRPVDI